MSTDETNRPHPLPEVFGNVLTETLIRRPSVPGSSANRSTIELIDDDLRFGAWATLPASSRPEYRVSHGTCLAVADAVLQFVSGGKADVALKIPRRRYVEYQDADRDALSASVAGQGGDAFDVAFMMATRFISLHEQGHYFNGHLHAILQARSNELSEVERSGESHVLSSRSFRQAIEHELGLDWPRASRALELQADAWAVRHLLGFGLRPERGRKSASERKKNEADPTAMDWFREAMTGVACACGLFETNDRFATSNPVERRHPPASQRCLTALHELGSMLHRAVGTVEEMARFVGPVIDDFGSMLSAIGVSPVSADDFNSAFGSTTELTEVVGSWRACRADLLLIADRLESFGKTVQQELDGHCGAK